MNTHQNKDVAHALLLKAIEDGGARMIQTIPQQRANHVLNVMKEWKAKEADDEKELKLCVAGMGWHRVTEVMA